MKFISIYGMMYNASAIVFITDVKPYVNDLFIMSTRLTGDNPIDLYFVDMVKEYVEKDKKLLVDFLTSDKGGVFSLDRLPSFERNNYRNKEKYPIAEQSLWKKK